MPSVSRGEQDSTLTFAIGDIHGMHEKLTTLLARCKAFGDGRPHRLVFLGDYIDRGNSSKEVIEIIMGLRGDEPPPILLRGNHEQMLIDAAASPEAELTWHMNGGADTLNSYGVANAFDIPSAHLEFLRSLPCSYDDGLRFFVHAGVDPSVSLTRQKAKHLLWAREPFLSSKRDFGRLVVHGHTPTSTGAPELLSNRLNVDTGAVYGRCLTAAVFNDCERMPVAFLHSDPN